MQRANGFYFNIRQHSGHCGHCETYSKQPPPSLFRPALSHPDLDIQASIPKHAPPPPSISSDNSICLWSAWWTSTQSSNSHRVWFAMQPQCVAMLKPPHCVAVCWTGLSVLSVKSKALPPALWQSTLPLEPLIITCEGGLVIFLIILHFISIPPFKTQHENWLPQRSIFIIFPRPINYSTLGQGGRAMQAQADPFHRKVEQSHITAVCWGSETEWGCSFSRWKWEGKKSTLVILWTLKHVR